MEGLMVHAGSGKIGRQDLSLITTPAATETHVPVPHADIVGGVIESLGYRRIEVVRDEYAVSKDGMRMFGVMDLSLEDRDIRFSLGIRNAHDKSFSFAMTVGYRVFVCDNLAFSGDFTPVTRKHTKNWNYVEVIGSALERMQRSFKPLVQQIDVWKNHSLPDSHAKEIIYQAFIAGDEFPKHLAKHVHHHYFEPEYEEFQPRNMWSLQNAFTSAFKVLEPIPQYAATAKLPAFLETTN
jgi:hypothetical protein